VIALIWSHFGHPPLPNADDDEGEDQDEDDGALGGHYGDGPRRKFFAPADSARLDPGLGVAGAIGALSALAVRQIAMPRALAGDLSLIAAVVAVVRAGRTEYGAVGRPVEKLFAGLFARVRVARERIGVRSVAVRLASGAVLVRLYADPFVAERELRGSGGGRLLVPLVVSLSFCISIKRGGVGSGGRRGHGR
jgi:hypothetical protein